jgi:hypothetical protein
MPIGPSACRHPPADPYLRARPFRASERGGPCVGHRYPHTEGVRRPGAPSRAIARIAHQPSEQDHPGSDTAGHTPAERHDVWRFSAAPMRCPATSR